MTEWLSLLGVVLPALATAFAAIAVAWINNVDKIAASARTTATDAKKTAEAAEGRAKRVDLDMRGYAKEHHLVEQARLEVEKARRVLDLELLHAVKTGRSNGELSAANKEYTIATEKYVALLEAVIDDDEKGTYSA